MNIVDLCKIKYQGMVEANNILFGQNDEGDIFIAKWDVPDIEQPSVEQLLAELPDYQREFDVSNFKSTMGLLISNLLDTKALERNYDNQISIVGYVNSTNTQWQAEAQAFILWRDSVWALVFAQYDLIDSGADIPNTNDFITSLPQIVWPS